jgi:hypothetical protein
MPELKYQNGYYDYHHHVLIVIGMMIYLKEKMVLALAGLGKIIFTHKRNTPIIKSNCMVL